MSTDSTPNEDGEQIDKVADRVIDRLQERDDVDLSRIESKAIDISRRQILGAAAAAGLGGVIGSAGTARAAGEDFTNSSGTVGTDDQPLSEVNVQNLHGESGTVDSLNANTVAIGDAFSADSMFSVRYRPTSLTSVSGDGVTTLPMDEVPQLSSATQNGNEWVPDENKTAFFHANVTLANYADGDRFRLQLRDLTDSFVLLESRMVGPGTGDSNSNQHSVVFSGIRTVIEGHTYDWAIDALDGGADMTTQTQVNAHEIFIGGQNQP